MSQHIIPPTHLKKFVFGGQSTFTVVSESGTGNRFTFKLSHPVNTEVSESGKEVKKIDRDAPIFVKVLNGRDNTRNYAYLGFISKDKTKFVHGGAKAKAGVDALSVKVITKLIEIIARGEYPKNATIYHEGVCGVCGRKLSVPSSILSGIGPVCDKSYDENGNKIEDRKRKLKYILGGDADSEWHG